MYLMYVRMSRARSGVLSFVAVQCTSNFRKYDAALMRMRIVPPLYSSKTAMQPTTAIDLPV